MPESNIAYFSGLDLGKLSDFTALAVLERCTEVVQTEQHPFREPIQGEPEWAGKKPVKKRVNHYSVVRLHRYDIGTPYDFIVDGMVTLFGIPPLTNSVLVPDKTGVGEAVCDQLHRARWDGVIQQMHQVCLKCNGTGRIEVRKGDYIPCRFGVQKAYREKLQANIRPVSITHGAGWKEDGQGWVVSKKELASNLQVLLQQQRLKVAPALERAGLLLKELQNFKVKLISEKNATYEAWREGDHDDLVLAVAIAAWVAERGLKDFWVR